MFGGLTFFGSLCFLLYLLPHGFAACLAFLFFLQQRLLMSAHGGGPACLFVTHDLALLPAIADRVIVMHGGKVVEEGTVQEVVRQAKSPHTQELLAADFFRLPREENGGETS